MPNRRTGATRRARTPGRPAAATATAPGDYPLTKVQAHWSRVFRPLDSFLGVSKCDSSTWKHPGQQLLPFYPEAVVPNNTHGTDNDLWKRRKPALCYLSTVSGWTTQSALSQPCQIRECTTQKIRSLFLRLGRFLLLSTMSGCCRSAKFPAAKWAFRRRAERTSISGSCLSWPQVWSVTAYTVKAEARMAFWRATRYTEHGNHTRRNPKKHPRTRRPH